MKSALYLFNMLLIFSILESSTFAFHLKKSYFFKQINLSAIHNSYNTLLKKHINNNGQVNYKKFKNDIQNLQKYIKSLQDINVKTLQPNEQLAFWINIYNACTIEQVLNNYPCTSIKEIENGKVWDKPLPYTFGGEKLTLNQIEHQKLIQQFNDPRIHFAINCAAISCPKLNNIAYTAQNVQLLLHNQTSLFINNQTHNLINEKKVIISQIFNWYKTDFEKTNGTVQNFINKYAKNKIIESANINYMAYSWGLNQ